MDNKEKDSKNFITWNEVPVDTKILVRDTIADRWERRYFAKYENGKVYAFDGGKTSWSADSWMTTPWAFAKLA